MKTRIISFILCFALLICLPVSSVSAKESDDGEITVIACSDFQNKTGNDQGQKTVMSILSAMKSDGISRADGFFCCGDYDYDTFSDLNSTKDGIKHLKAALDNMVDSKNMVLVKGNHDVPASFDAGISPSGNNDPAGGGYGVFVINEDDYRTRRGKRGHICERKGIFKFAFRKVPRIFKDPEPRKE